jgi:hypothetical protein
MNLPMQKWSMQDIERTQDSVSETLSIEGCDSEDDGGLRRK